MEHHILQYVAILVSLGLAPSKIHIPLWKKNCTIALPMVFSSSLLLPGWWWWWNCYDDYHYHVDEEEEDNYHRQKHCLTSRASWQAWRCDPRAVAPLLRTPPKYPQEDERPNVMPEEYRAKTQKRTNFLKCMEEIIKFTWGFAIICFGVLFGQLQIFQTWWKKAHRFC